ncbi:unnamed protein product [Schistosoma mattheei]|uniref:PUA domain-containing protein n=1 Tax=Schistosoma mattheei TaxID=31246 RepID=A0AA85BXF6_9TREM|nr:unnamed protein product [Schistosoma mattheei]
MFKKFDEKEDISCTNNAKNSIVKSLRTRLTEGYGIDSKMVDQILPKKDVVKHIKCHEHVDLYSDSDGEVMFFRQREGPFIPSLRLLHKYPFILPHLQVDRGAIKHVLNGSNIMCRGLTSPGARMTEVPKESVVAVMAEGKKNALAVGITMLSTDEILSTNNGIGVKNVHYLNDGLWRLKGLHCRKYKGKTCVFITLCFFAAFLYFTKHYIVSDAIIRISDWKWGPAGSQNCPVFDHSKEDPTINRMAVLVPFRDRFTELQEFIPHLNNFLNNQNVRHTFFIINQVDDLRFNRGALLNVGALESLEAEVNGIIVESVTQKNSLYQLSSQCLKLPFTKYLALHDVDLLPEDPALKYNMPSELGPIHLIPFYLHPRYYYFKEYAGGVLIIKRTQYSLVGGMSNSFWGWGREDDEFQIRLKSKGFKIVTPINVTMGLKAFRHIHQEDQHKRDVKTYYNPDVMNLIRNPIGGLTSVNYTVIKRRLITISSIPAIVINVKLYCDSMNCKLKS